MNTFFSYLLSLARGPLYYETTRDTTAFTSSGAPRDTVPAGWTFQGWGDSTWRYASADALPWMKKGWKVRVEDTQLVQAEPEPEPEPPPPTPDPGPDVDPNDLMIHEVGGIVTERFARLLE